MRIGDQVAASSRRSLSSIHAVDGIGPLPLGVETGGIDRVQGLGGRGGVLLGAGRTSPIDEDAEEPGLERRAPFERLDAPDQAQPGVLHGFLGHGLAGDEAPGQTQHGLLVAAHQGHERFLVAVAEPGHHLDVRVHGAQRRTPGG